MLVNVCLDCLSMFVYCNGTANPAPCSLHPTNLDSMPCLRFCAFADSLCWRSFHYRRVFLCANVIP